MRLVKWPIGSLLHCQLLHTVNGLHCNLYYLVVKAECKQCLVVQIRFHENDWYPERALWTGWVPYNKKGLVRIA